jgi:hypothetical protein
MSKRLGILTVLFATACGNIDPEQASTSTGDPVVLDSTFEARFGADHPSLLGRIVLSPTHVVDFYEAGDRVVAYAEIGRDVKPTAILAGDVGRMTPVQVFQSLAREQPVPPKVRALLPGRAGGFRAAAARPCERRDRASSAGGLHQHDGSMEQLERGQLSLFDTLRNRPGPARSVLPEAEQHLSGAGMLGPHQLGIHRALQRQGVARDGVHRSGNRHPGVPGGDQLRAPDGGQDLWIQPESRRLDSVQGGRRLLRRFMRDATGEVRPVPREQRARAPRVGLQALVTAASRRQGPHQAA